MYNTYLSDGAWAVRDGQGGWLVDGVGLLANADGGRLGAVGGVSRDDLGGGDGGTIAMGHGGHGPAVISSSDGANKGSDSEDLCVHFERCLVGFFF